MLMRRQAWDDWLNDVEAEQGTFKLLDRDDEENLDMWAWYYSRGYEPSEAWDERMIEANTREYRHPEER